MAPPRPEGSEENEQPQQHHLCYAAALENRAREVGVAVLDVPRLTLRITQHIEAGRFHTTTQLLLGQPRQVAVVAGQHHEVAGAASLNHQLAAGPWELAPLPRAAFDDVKGRLAVQELASGSAQGPRGAADASCYLGFGAAGALLHHVRRNLGLAIAPRSLQVEFGGPRHLMLLDRDAVAALEILPPSRSQSALQQAVASSASASAAAGRPLQAGGGRGAQRSAAPPASRATSLFGFLNHTATAAGARLLRTNLLQPLTDITTLELRLDSLALELIALVDSLPKNLGRLVSSVVLLRDVLRCLPVMAESMAWVDSRLLRVRPPAGQGQGA